MSGHILNLVSPVPNLNGNTHESIIEQLHKYSLILGDCIDAMRECSDCWHGRNFQTLENGQIWRDMAESAWRLRAETLGLMAKEVMALAVDVQRQQKGMPKRELDHDQPDVQITRPGDHG